jgi:hypothetical protein
MLQAAYPGARWTEATADLYELMLADLDIGLASAALQRLIYTSKFLPSVAEIRAAAADVALGPQRSGLDAWGDVLKAIRFVGSYGVPTFEDPLVGRCVTTLGWRSLCLSDTPEGVDRARFAELYERLQSEERVRDVSEPGRLLPGGRAEPAQLPAQVRELTEGVFKPLQPDHGRTGTERARRL